MARTLRKVLDGLAFAEGPRWRDGRLWFSDMHAHEVVAVTPEGVRETIATSPFAVSGLGWLPDGTLLVVSMDDRKLKKLVGGKLVDHADLSGVATINPNDMVVDAKGRAYVGNFGYSLYPPEPQKPAKMALVEPDGSVSVAAEDLIFPNGTVITADGKTLIVGETFAARMTAYDIAADGSLSNRRVWAQLPQGAVPDGCCLDAEGAIWVASPTSNEVLRIHEGGRVSERIDTGIGAYACMLGGADRKTLFILICQASDPQATATERGGSIVATEVEVAGAGLP